MGIKMSEDKGTKKAKYVKRVSRSVRVGHR